MITIYCEVCDKKVEFEIEEIRKDDLNEKPWGDIVCSRCQLVIATLSSEKEGEVNIVFEEKIEEAQKVIEECTTCCDPTTKYCGKAEMAKEWLKRWGDTE